MICFCDLNHGGKRYFGTPRAMRRMVDDGAACYPVEPSAIELVSVAGEVLADYSHEYHGETVIRTRRQVAIVPEHLLHATEDTGTGPDMPA